MNFRPLHGIVLQDEPPFEHLPEYEDFSFVSTLQR